ncbi:MAG TPA: thiamine-phosphate kinase [Terracidiphilus sp.]
MTPKRYSGELALVDRIRSRAGGGRGAALRLGIGDDCALLQIKPGEEIAITTDLSIAGRHFRLDWHPPETVGHRTLARGLSDLAAMGARPLAAFLSLGLPENLIGQRGRIPSWVDRFFDGFLALAADFKTPLAGGDLSGSPVAIADILLVGAVPRGKALLRSGARPGDLLYITGALGGSAAGLDHLQKNQARNFTARNRRPRDGSGSLAAHLWPQPRIPQGLWLERKGAATAAIDISDGLSTDLDHICIESRVGAEIDAVSLPVFRGASLEQALHGGEDYELLFAARPGTRIPARIGGVSVTRIGRIVKAQSGRSRIVLLTNAGPQPLPRHGWEHFA